jgi:uncharacterized membrane protein
MHVQQQQQHEQEKAALQAEVQALRMTAAVATRTAAVEAKWCNGFQTTIGQDGNSQMTVGCDYTPKQNYIFC